MDTLDCVCVCVRGFYGTSVTLAASVLHHAEWVLVGKHEGDKYAGTHLCSIPHDKNKSLESSSEARQQQPQYIV